MWQSKEQMPLLLLSRFSRVQRCATLWTAAHQAPLSTGYSRQEYWSGLPLPSPDPWSAAAVRRRQMETDPWRVWKRNPTCSATAGKEYILLVAM